MRAKIRILHRAGKLRLGFEVGAGAGPAIGLTPFIRYDFVTGCPWMPFAEVGAGLSETDIGRPDLRSRFNFNLQAGAGTYYFLQKDKALMLRVGYLHLSNAGIETPNPSENLFMLGFGWSGFF